MDRRSFVKTCVLAGSAGALGAGSFGIARALVEPREPRASVVRYYGARSVSGPAPRGVPYVPITVEDGAFVAKTKLSYRGRDMDVLEWHRFCGRRDAPGLDPGFTDDNTLTFASRPEHELFIRPWFRDLVGKPVRPEDFPDVGFGADFLWRSQGIAEAHALPGIILRVDPPTIQRLDQRAGNALPLDRREWEFVKREVFWNGFIAVSSVCTHFCCVAGYKTAERLARPRGAWENVYCTCHSANFDPRQPVAHEIEVEPRLTPTR